MFLARNVDTYHQYFSISLCLA